MEHCNVKAGLSFRTRKKNQATKTQNLKLKLKLPKNSRKLWENSICQNFFQNNSRISFFLENSRVFFPKTQGFSKYTQGFSPNTRFTDLPEIFFSFVTRKSAKQQACVKETLQNRMRSLNIQWDGTSKCSLGLDWDPKTEIHQCSGVRQTMFAGWGKRGKIWRGSTRSTEACDG